jgi:DNA-binding MarR family transcriptional regulator|tara:strand:+ start:1358 stop:1528 length:171 start_codon:yes stop_codon:yes gene_type:complete
MKKETIENVSDTLEEMLKDGLVDIKTDESGEFHFRLSEKGNQIAEELIKDSGDNNA